MIKKSGIVFALVFVLCFGSLVFAQNSNVHPMMSSGNMTSNQSGRGHRRHRRHHRSRRHRRARKGGNTNM